MKNLIYNIAFILVLIGAINWGLLGLANVNLVSTLFGISSISKVIYVLVGISGVYIALNRFFSYKVL